MTFPPMVTMIPNYLLMKDIGFLNTFYALIIPGMANGYSIFLLKGFFDSLPRELYEAADIDAASEFHKFWHIAMSLSKPILAVIALGAFNGAYSNFMFAVVLCPDEKMWTLMVWLVQMQAFSSRGAMMASLVLSAIPTLVVFIFAQNIILRGIVLPVEK
jgi:multiple sugar transport system permease protein